MSATVDAKRTSPPQASFGRYEVLFPIARGGMAEVLAVRLRGEGAFERYFAIKRMASDLIKHEKFVASFLDEARLTACIHSPHVVQVVDLGRDDRGAPYLVMELVHGVSLTALRRYAKSSLPLGAIVEIGLQAALGLEDAHVATDARGAPLGIIHRDVSPQNILVAADGRVRIADFGIARAKQRLAQGTQSGELKGKFGYFAPEQLRGDSTPRTDVFALAIVLWELIAEQSLFQRKEVVDTLMNVERMPIPRLDVLAQEERAPPVPRELADVIARALERDPAARHPSARAFSVALRGLLERGVVARFELDELKRLATDAARPLLDRLQLSASGEIPLGPDAARLSQSIPLRPEDVRSAAPGASHATSAGGESDSVPSFVRRSAPESLGHDAERYSDTPVFAPFAEGDSVIEVDVEHIGPAYDPEFVESPTLHRSVPVTRGPRDRELAAAALEAGRLSEMETARMIRRRRPVGLLTVLGYVLLGAVPVAGGAAATVFLMSEPVETAARTSEATSAPEGAPDDSAAPEAAGPSRPTPVVELPSVIETPAGAETHPTVVDLPADPVSDVEATLAVEPDEATTNVRRRRRERAPAEAPAEGDGADSPTLPRIGSVAEVPVPLEPTTEEPNASRRDPLLGREAFEMEHRE